MCPIGNQSQFRGIELVDDWMDYRGISQDELSASLAADRKFEGCVFPAGVTFDDLDCTKAQFVDCLFQSQSTKGADFSEAAFRNCKFVPSRFASSKFTDAQFTGCGFFDSESKTGCTFAAARAAIEAASVCSR